ncbi:chromate transporter, partial [Pseudomonas aeruginosa]|uniref:chromate transporter n=1 Tax=Pseudomonas aeruginosa TaxID=287 RepID=UPI001FF267C6
RARRLFVIRTDGAHGSTRKESAAASDVYKMQAVAMTVGVFLPAFAFSLIFYDRLEAVVENKRLHAFLDGVAAGVVGLIGATTIDLAQVTAERVPSLTVGMSIFAAGLAFLYAWKNKLNVVVVILAAGLAGWLVFPNQG